MYLLKPLDMRARNPSLLMRLRFLSLVFFAFTATATWAQDYANLEAEPHHYWKRKPQDPFTKLMDRLATGEQKLATGDDNTALRSLLQALDIPVSSQMLVYSATSLQSGRITPRNPRALYFNEHTYVGFVPGGRLEIISLDPDLGAIFYILDVPNDKRPPKADRSTRCMNCHSGERMNFAPGLAMESVIASDTGATLEGYRRGLFGHGIPFEDRFGGWYVTGEGNIKKHHGNLIGALSPAGLKLQSYKPGELFNWSNYLISSSDILPQLLHEHQAGFVNHVVEGTYRARFMLHQSGGKLTFEQEKILDKQADIITRYVLFADEVPLPKGGIVGDGTFKKDFLQTRQTSSAGVSLKDFDLQTRLFRYRCSYMIYTDLWDAMPDVLKNRVYAKMLAALSETKSLPEYAYLSVEEKKAIRNVIAETKTGLPEDWK